MYTDAEIRAALARTPFEFGKACERAGDYNEASKHYSRALDIDPSHAAASEAMARLRRVAPLGGADLASAAAGWDGEGR